MQNTVNKNNYHNNSLPYSVPAILQVTSTLNPGNHVLAIFKTFIFLCHLHLSLFKYLPKFLIYILYIHVTVHRKRVLTLNNQPVALIVQIYSVVCWMYSSKPWWLAQKMPETGTVLWHNKFGQLLRLVGYLKKKSLSVLWYNLLIFSCSLSAYLYSTFIVRVKKSYVDTIKYL